MSLWLRHLSCECCYESISALLLLLKLMFLASLDWMSSDRLNSVVFEEH